MEDYSYNRSRSYGYGGGGVMRMELDHYYGPTRAPPLPPPPGFQTQMANRDRNLKKGKTFSGSSSSSKPWSFDGDREFQRKKRVASYKMYSVEGKMKGSFRKSFRWLKDKYTQVLYGW
ncbi:uncharacterized protein LOC133805030 [Humulus lupulus]|uniref:uncharacterized protein LOC133805030 n=1 Tax=Humulus lupulus TaxID=3486 RepID=UPI002B405E04|nr:uncharacterized protein LOC133805030 [Humulus lupulus]